MTLSTLQRICEVLEIEPVEIFQFTSIKTNEEMCDYIYSKLEKRKGFALSLDY